MNGTVYVILIVVVVIFIGLVVSNKNTAEELKNEEHIEHMSKIVKTKILDAGTDGTKAGGVGRAIVGDVVSHAVGVKGHVGAIVGATTAGHKNKGFTVFKVWYDDGHTDVERVAHDDPKYMDYLKLLEDE